MSVTPKSLALTISKRSRTFVRYREVEAVRAFSRAAFFRQLSTTQLATANILEKISEVFRTLLFSRQPLGVDRVAGGNGRHHFCKRRFAVTKCYGCYPPFGIKGQNICGTVKRKISREAAPVGNRGFRVPLLEGLRDWVSRETKLANPALKAEVARTSDPDLILALAWSEDVNQIIGRTVRAVPPFPLVRESLEFLRGKADVMVVSATPTEALRREWIEHGLADLVSQIAGQDVGTKREILARATAGRYEPTRVLMIGDAPGDRKAAEANGVLFYPIDPGDEELSWQRLFEEAFPKFFEGTYAGTYMTEQIERFEALLPSQRPWA